jgi:hypothetical protein
LQKLDAKTGSPPEVQVVQDKPQQGESPMTMEQVNLQELQRLNDAITVTYEAIRRVAPQLQAVQQMAQMQVPWQQPYGFGMQQQPQHQQQHLLLPILQQLVQHLVQSQGQQQPWSQMPHFGQQPSPQTQSPFGFGQQLGQMPFGMGQQFSPQTQSPFGQQTPFGYGQQYGQRIF